MEIRQRFFDSPLGWIKLQQSGEIITMVNFIDDLPALINNAETTVLLGCENELASYFNGSLRSFCFLENAMQGGTSFQQKVWNELSNISYGETISYRQLAKKLGDEKSIRAAASANGKNNIAIAVPCHRVIGTDGSLTGYSGGLWRKKWLLEHEARFTGKRVQSLLFA